MRTAGRLCLMMSLAWGLFGCKQQDGERCEVDQDCASGLQCVAMGGGDSVCRPPGAVTPTRDAGADAVRTDTAPATDTATPDAPAADAATPDTTRDVPPADSSTGDTSAPDTASGN